LYLLVLDETEDDHLTYLLKTNANILGSVREA
jgi:hypothetical protein